jgi:hypothetical protein
MKKLRIDDLQVESFKTARTDEIRGTVLAKETEYPCWTAAPETRCYDSCQPPYSCGPLCDPQYPDTGT